MSSLATSIEHCYAADQPTVSARLAHLDTCLDRAVEAFAHVMRGVQLRLDGADVITDAQATEMKAVVQAIAPGTQRRGTPGTPYQGLWNELFRRFRRFRVPSYARIKISQALGVEDNGEDTGADGERQHGEAPSPPTGPAEQRSMGRSL